MIDGKITANGNVVIINPNGVMFGNNSKIDVNGLVATTSDLLSDDEFMNGGAVRFKAPDENAYTNLSKIENYGSITAKDSGLVGLVSPHVENHGIIKANLGKVALASGDIATIDFAGDGLIQLDISETATKQIINNSGIISADGGEVLLTAATGRAVVDSLITSNGDVIADKVLISSKDIKPTKQKPRQTDQVTVNGNIKSKNITIASDRILIDESANIDASQNSDGGNILIGGEYMGGGDVFTASMLHVSNGAQIKASSLINGDGGEIIFWSDGRTRFYGHAESKGGAQNGDGGFIEVSSKNHLDFQGTADLTANFGEFGQLLLDPTDIEISSAVSSNMTASSTFTPTVDNGPSVLNVTTLETALASGNVTVQTRATGAQAGDITVNTAITWSSANQLSLNAHGSIIVNDTITGRGIVFLTNNDVVLNAALSTNLLNNGFVTFRGRTNATSIGIGDGAPGTLNLSNAELALIDGGFNTVTFGHSISTEDIYVLGWDLSSKNFNAQLLGNDIFIQGMTLGAGNFTAQAIDNEAGPDKADIMVFADAITRSANGTATLDLRADQDILISGGGNITQTGTGVLNIRLNSNRDNAVDGGAIDLQDVTFTSNNGTISATGGNLDAGANGGVAGDGIVDGYAVGTAVYNNGIYLNNADFVSGLGSIFMMGQGKDTLPFASRAGIYFLGDSNLSSTSGRIYLRGQGGNSVADGGGLFLYGGSLSSETGDVVIDGFNGSLSTGSYASAITLNTFLVETTGTNPLTAGDIIINGTGGTGASVNTGFRMLDSTIRTNAGNISATGTGGTSTATSAGLVTGADAFITTTIGSINLNGSGLNEDVQINGIVGGATTSGNITIAGNTLALAGIPNLLHTSGTLTIKPRTSGTIINLGGATGGLDLSDAELATINAGTLVIGDSALGTGAVNFNSVSFTGNTEIYGGAMTVNNGLTSAGSLLLKSRGASADITLNSVITANGTGSALTLASARNLVNNAGASALNTPSGRWLSYSQTPGGDTRGGVTAGFRRFSCTYGGACPAVPMTGNGFLYATTTPTLTVTPTALNVNYGDTLNLVNYTYSVSGYLDSDAGADVLTGALTGASAYTSFANAGTNHNINYASGTLSSAIGYSFSYVNNATALSVLKRDITAVVGSTSRVYGDANPIFNWSNVTWNNLANSETGSVIDAVTVSAPSAVATSNAGTNHAINISGFSDNNYNLTGFTAGNLGITKSAITVIANSYVRRAGEENPMFDYDVTGLKNSDLKNIVTGVTLATNANLQSAKGLYDIILTGGSADNYTINQINGQLRVTESQNIPSVADVGRLIHTNASAKDMKASNSDVFIPSSESQDKNTVFKKDTVIEDKDVDTVKYKSNENILIYYTRSIFNHFFAGNNQSI